MVIEVRCDGCDNRVDASVMWAEVDVRGAVRVKDQTRYDWCGTCLSQAVRAVKVRANQAKSS